MGSTGKYVHRTDSQLAAGKYVHGGVYLQNTMAHAELVILPVFLLVFLRVYEV